jgi:hypothetical protein
MADRTRRATATSASLTAAYRAHTLLTDVPARANGGRPLRMPLRGHGHDPVLGLVAFVASLLGPAATSSTSATGGAAILNITGINAANPLRNVHDIVPKAARRPSTEIFRAGVLLLAWRKCSTCASCWGANDARRSRNWERCGRAPRKCAGRARAGVPVEIMRRLAKPARRRRVVLHPEPRRRHYGQQFATTCATTSSRRKAYDSTAKEVWNLGFAQAVLRAAARARAQPVEQRVRGAAALPLACARSQSPSTVRHAFRRYEPHRGCAREPGRQSVGPARRRRPFRTLAGGRRARDSAVLRPLVGPKLRRQFPGRT